MPTAAAAHIDLNREEIETDSNTLTPPLPPAAITLTAHAAEMIKNTLIAENLEHQALRIGVIGGGCAGLQYLLDFTDTVTPDDLIYQQLGVTIYIDPFSASHLAGTIIDYVEDAEGAGFKFDNPNIQKTCACSAAKH